MTTTYRVAIYASPGYLDMWSIRYWLYRITVALKKTVAVTRIYVIGSGGRSAIEEFCRTYKYHWFPVDAPDPKAISESVKTLKEAFDPDVLLAFTKGGETAWSYATLATELGMDVVLTSKLTGEHNN